MRWGSPGVSPRDREAVIPKFANQIRQRQARTHRHTPAWYQSNGILGKRLRTRRFNFLKRFGGHVGFSGEAR
jgi:hypothetical protein